MPTNPPSRSNHDRGAYVWLAYSVFFFVEPVLRHSTIYWLEQIPFYFVFLALYIAYVHFDSSRARLPIVAAIFVLGVVAIPHNVGGSSFFIYVAALLPFCAPSQTILAAVLALEVATLAIENWLFPGNSLNYLFAGFFAAVVGVTNLFVAQKKRVDAQLRVAQEENIALAALAERERIARDLHDVLGHTLSVIVLKAELAGRLLTHATAPDPARAAAEIADVERTARTALAEVREAIGGYRARGLAAELEQARGTLASAGVVLSCESPVPRLPAAEETVLALAVREAVTNIVRHARARHCRMTFHTTPDGFHALTVQDDGAGLPPATSIQTLGNGLRGMRERVQSLGGRLRIEAGEAAAGTRLTIELPTAPALALQGNDLR
jgi:two-component system sensor histidine kinase DesK